MKKIQGNKVASLLFKNMTDTEVIELLNSLGLEQPILDEQYKINLDINILGDNCGISFQFKEIKNYTSNGEPCLFKISFDDDKIVSFPYGIKVSDNYNTCREKIGKKADFRDEELFPEMRMWIMDSPFGLKYTFNIFFEDSNLNKVDEITIMKYNENLDNADNYIINEE